MFDDTSHVRNEQYTGEEPTTAFFRGPDGISVNLACGPDPEMIYQLLYAFLQSTWSPHPLDPGDYADTPEEREYIRRAFEGKTLPQALEGLSFWFQVDGVTRACTHQLVRTRIGCAVMQHGGRDNDWRHRSFSIPETVARTRGLENCITDEKPIRQYLREVESNFSDAGDLEVAVCNHVERSKRLYAAMVDAGIPYQDARRILPIGTQTHISLIYTWPALQNMLSKRLEHQMDWEMNCVAQLMVREVCMKCDPLLGENLRSGSDRAKRDMFADMDLVTPPGKWPCNEIQKHRPRVMRPEQNPFWILAPESFQPGSEVRWIPTNGVWPEEVSRDR